MPDQQILKNTRMTIEVSIRLIALILLIAWCVSILIPFLGPVVWGIIIAVSIEPLYHSLNRRIGGKRKLTAFLIIAGFVLIIAIPSFIIASALLDNLQDLGSELKDGSLKIPPANDKVAEWPLIGEKVFDVWNAFSSNTEAAVNNYEEQIVRLGKMMISGISTFVKDILLIIVAFIIAGVLLATKGTREVTMAFYQKLVGKRAEEFSHVIEATIRNVTKGILGVAFIQGLLMGILFVLADIPYAGIWALLVMILAVIQLPAIIVGIPAIIYLYSAEAASTATLWAVLICIGGLADNFLKPLLLGKGAPVPMLVIFLGAIGGFIMSGLVGLFTGAIVLSLGYKIFITWLREESALSETTPTETTET